MEYNNQLSENDKRFADEFSNYVNGKMASPRKVGKALADDPPLFGKRKSQTNVLLYGAVGGELAQGKI